MKPRFRRLAAATVALTVGWGAATLDAASGDRAETHRIITAVQLREAVYDALAFEMMSGRRTLAIIDVRSRSAFEAGHIPRAIHLAAEDVIVPESAAAGDPKSAGDLAARLERHGIAKDADIVLYGDRSGPGAARMVRALRHLGHRTVRILFGGLQAWTEHGGGLTGNAAAGSPTVTGG